MAITKNKTELLDMTISLSSAIEDYFSEGYDYYYDYYDDYYGCCCPSCSGYYTDDFEYLEDDICNLVYLFRRGKSAMSFGKSPKIGRMIDMRKVYSKEIMRDKNIDIILGLSKEFQKITIGDLYYEECRDIQRRMDH